MQFKPFYVHFQVDHQLRRKHKPRGFTAFIQPGDGRNVKVQVSFCSNEDEFVKAQGRKAAEKAPIELFNARRVPELLAACERATAQKAGYESSWVYLYKYML